MGDSLATIYGGGDTAVTIVDTASTQLQLAFPNLRPSIKDFTHNDGAQQRLACLYGTIPTRPQTSNGPVYNIPVDVWLPTRFPQAAPTVYVIGTSTVGIRTSPIVDTSGRVTTKLPFFFWDPDEQYPASAVVTLIEDISTAFGKAIPVYSRAQGDGAPRASGVPRDVLVSRSALLRAAEKKVMIKKRMIDAVDAAVLARLQDVNSHLKLGQQQLTALRRRGLVEVATAQTSTSELEHAIVDLDSKLVAAAELKNKPPDTLAIANAPLHHQMLNLVAEIAALEDVLMTVGHSLRAGEVKLPEYLKLTRGVLHQQFNARVLLLKARDVAMMAYQ